jgi:hypothetical protein
MIKSSSLHVLKTSLLAPAATVAAFALSPTAYSATMAQVPVTDDASSGISSSNTYTHAFDFGNTDSGGAPTTYTVNSVVFSEPTNATTSYTDATTGKTLGVAATAGSLNVNAGRAVNGVTNEVQNIYRDFLFLGGSFAAGTTISFTLDGLVQGQTYSARFYGYGWDSPSGSTSGTGRRVTLSTDADATTGTYSWNAFGRDNAFYLDTTYTAPGASTTITMTLPDAGDGPHLAAFTNQAVPEPGSLAFLAGGAGLLGILRRRRLQ